MDFTKSRILFKISSLLGKVIKTLENGGTVTVEDQNKYLNLINDLYKIDEEAARRINGEYNSLLPDTEPKPTKATTTVDAKIAKGALTSAGYRVGATIDKIEEVQSLNLKIVHLTFGYDDPDEIKNAIEDFNGFAEEINAEYYSE